MNADGVREHGTPRCSGTNHVGIRRGINAGVYTPARKTLLSITYE
ncbi:MAG: hypothetical protein ACRCUY_09900 [Thermoguttaceae bacterium]